MHETLRWSYYKGAKPKLDESGKPLLAFNAYRDKYTTQQGDWPALIEVMKPTHTVPKFYLNGTDVDRKEGKCTLPAISGAYYDTDKRGNDFALGSQLLIFDIDSKHKGMEVSDLNEILTKVPYKFAYYESYSHNDPVLNPDKLHKCRLVFPLTRGVRPDLWKEFVTWACSHLGFDPHLDCLDLGAMRKVAQIYFLRGNWDNNATELVVRDGPTLGVPPDEDLECIPVPPIAGEVQGTSMSEHEFKKFIHHYGVDFRTLDLEALLRAKGLKVGPERQIKDGVKHRCHCPWASDHTGGRDDDAAWITMVDDKWPRFNCSHSGCADRQLADVLDWAGAELVRQYADPYEARKTAPIHPMGGNLAWVVEGGPQAPGGPAAAGEISPEKKLQRTRNEIRHKLVLNENGTPRAAGGNLVTIFNLDPVLQGKFAVNEMGDDLLWGKESMTTYHMSDIQQMLLIEYGLNASIAAIEYECRSQGDRNLFNPARSYFDGLKWDGQSRFAALATDILHLNGENLLLYTTYLTNWMVAAVTRSYRPGAKFDSILVLVGSQGRKKSMFFQILGGAFYGVPDQGAINSTDSKMALHRNLINEIAEIDKLNGKTDARLVKNLLSVQSDLYRVPYGRKVTDHPRKFICAGTANEPEGLLADFTGSRRWWIIEVGDEKIDTEKLAEMRDQLWAEAKALFQAGHQIWLDDEQDQVRGEVNTEFEAYDPYTDLLLKYMPTLESQVKWATRKDLKKPGIPMDEILQWIQVPEHMRVLAPTAIVRGLSPALKRMGWSKKKYEWSDEEGKRRTQFRWLPPNLTEILARPEPSNPQVFPLITLSALPPAPGAQSDGTGDTK